MRAVLDIFSQVVRTLWAHKLRSFLTMFGIAWGVFSLLLLVGLGEGFRSGNRRELETMGKDIMFIFPGRVPAVEGQQGMKPYFITYQDFLDIRKEATLVRNASPVLQRGDIRAVSEFTTSNGQVVGIAPNFNQIRYLPMGEGRWLNDGDEEQRRNVAVLGFQMSRNLFSGHPALGSTILLNGVRFEVIGILSSVGKNENNSTNFRVYIPFSTMRLHFPLKNGDTIDDISFINCQPVAREQHGKAIEQMHRILGRNHGFDYHNKDAFEEFDTIQTEAMVGKIFDAMDLFLGSVGMVTLCLGAIGIINIMLVSVTERTREIGLRKALGATNRSILMQFFLEGAFITAISGGLGLAIAAGIMAALGTLPSPEGFDPPRLVPASAAIAIISLSLAGTVAGLYPARKASMLQPVEALRKE
ncbi:MAG TPA: ABC transporter permease [Candidatus Saccharimonadales bacterium]|jgi:putative ABC transport system permease protein|nr:ABC transporter permease [Candidatus Saccharimonadales bacterium]